MNRRKLLVAFGLGALGGALPSLAQQKGKVARVGFFYFGSRQSAVETGRYDAFLTGMRELGYVEGKNFVLEARYADGNVDRVADMAAELVGSKVDVIVSTATPLNQVLRKTAGTTPVVFTLSPDPVGEGLAKSLARPGGNFTGLANITVELSQKYLELLAASIANLSRVGVLWNPANSSHPPQLLIIRAAAKTRGMRVFEVEVRAPGDIERGLSNLARDRANALMVLGDGLFLQQVRQIAELSMKHRLPSFFPTPDGPEFGCLMSYGANIRDNFRRAPAFVVRILKGAKPGDLPIEQPTKFELVVNLKTAKALGLTLPQPFLMRADRVIE